MNKKKNLIDMLHEPCLFQVSYFNLLLNGFFFIISFSCAFSECTSPFERLKMFSIHFFFHAFSCCDQIKCKKPTVVKTHLTVSAVHFENIMCSNIYVHTHSHTRKHTRLSQRNIENSFTFCIYSKL